MENAASNKNDAEKNRQEKVTDTFPPSEKSLNAKPLHQENQDVSTPKPDIELEKNKKFTRTQLFSLIGISVANFCAGSCASMQSPFFPPEAEKKGATATQYGFIFGVYPLALFATSLVLGKVSHYVSPKLFLNLGLLTVGTTCIIFGTLDLLADTTTFIAAAFITRIFEGVGSAVLKTFCYIIIASQFKESTGTATGIIEMAYSVSYIIGPALGGVLYDLGGYGLPFYSMGTVAVVDVIAMYFFLPGSERSKILEKGSVFELWLHPRMMIYSLSIFTTYNIVGFNHATLGMHLRDFDLSGFVLGVAFALPATTNAFANPVWGRLCDKKFCSLKLNLLSSIILIFSLLLLGPAPFFNIEPCIWFVIAALALLGAAIGGKMVCSFIGAMDDTLNRGIPQNMATIGAVSSMRIASQSLGAFIGSSVGGFLLDNLGYRRASVTPLFLEIVLIISLIVSIWRKKSRIKETELIHSIEEVSVNESYIANDEE